MSGDSSRAVRKTRDGVVVSESMDKTRVILVERRVRHKLYGKEMKRSQKCYVHDEKNESHLGDVIRIMETRPMSRTKRWRLVDIVTRAKGPKAVAK